VSGDVPIHRRINPHFGLADVRQGAGVEAERAWTPWLRTDPDRPARNPLPGV
jgi:hypothetical protein